MLTIVVPFAMYGVSLDEARAATACPVEEAPVPLDLLDRAGWFETRRNLTALFFRENMVQIPLVLFSQKARANSFPAVSEIIVACRPDILVLILSA